MRDGHQSASQIDTEQVEKLYRELLFALGQDPDREGLLDTPRRVAAWWNEFLSQEPSGVETSFTESHVNDQLVVVHGIGVWSLCEHHLLPFRLDMAIGYIPGTQVLGLSKFARIARRNAQQLQLQERLTRDVLRDIVAAVGTEDVAVAARGEHLCMSMRGVRMESAVTTTVAMSGRIETDAVLSGRFLAIAQSGGSARAGAR
ncbi:GTP cyclohydrolase I [Streptomyces sp. NPDC057521]|uniref:GTP cyclohydrolase I n=1 Tax=Streptomyces sp. NPDC057521 TaxID=3346156 RepID=UPI00368D1F60